MCEKIFNSGFMSKILFVAVAGVCILFLQLKIEKLQSQLAAEKEQCQLLQSANKKQQENIEKLLLEHKKQEELILQAEQEKQALEQNYQAKQRQVHKSNDNASANWKTTKLPESILQIIKQQ